MMSSKFHIDFVGRSNVSIKFKDSKFRAVWPTDLELYSVVEIALDGTVLRHRRYGVHYGTHIDVIGIYVETTDLDDPLSLWYEPTGIIPADLLQLIMNNKPE